MSLDLKAALNQEILAQGHSDDALNRTVPIAVTNKNYTKRVANTTTTEWNAGNQTAPGGTFVQQWPEHLPRPPSRRRITDETDGGSSQGNSNVPQVVIFNANTQQGTSMVRVLSEKGLRVVAVVRVFTSKQAKRLTKLKNVQVKVADLNNPEAVKLAATGCQQAFLVTKYWERFESPVEEHMARVVLEASAEVGLQRLVFCTFEDTTELRLRGRKSQIMPTEDGRIFPKFEGMENIQAVSKNLGVSVTHMFTSYLDDEEHKKSLILIRQENGKIVCQDQIQTPGRSKSKKAKQ
uniref:NmrA-like domain-containing protein n=1 Tax=Amphora coffeiformis TaxID=265554 RepID=A0A7S3L9S0_9STRA|mmetsp:Transcript_1781/g.3917  ORF Transcript_1781/g.3917 Transcript_1781/m.3917 type:complete len:293 (+) Transcript_1781:186-1064(+)